MDRAALLALIIVGTLVLLTGVHFVLSLGSGHPCDVPQTSFAFESSPEESRMVVSHSGGDQIPAEQLFVRINNQTIVSSQDTGGSGAVTAGDNMLIQDVGPGDFVQVYLNRTGDAEPDRQRCKNPIMGIHTAESNAETPTS